jgi:hypothetical protein
MKKLILTFGLTLLAAGSFSQVVLHAEAPGAIVGNFVITNPTDWSADLSDPDNAVTDTVMVGIDSLACAPLSNNLTGKIALVYRGTCEFGAKALAAQNAGAVAVIIVNNAAGPPVGMGIGADGADVTIPVVMISQADGALIRSTMINDPVVMFLGMKNGHFANDIGLTVKDVLRADMNGTPSQIVQNDTEFTTTVGAVVRNFGFEDQTGITLTATVNHGTEVYSETSAPFDLEAGDSTELIELPDFSLPTYTPGTYTLTYTVDYDNNADEEYDADNTLITNFKIQDTLLSYSRLDPTTGLPMSTIGTQPADNEGSYSSCIVFSNPNASRLGAMGLYFGASINAPDSLDGQEVLVSAFRWDNQFTDVEDPALAFDALTEMFPSESYYFGANPTNGGQVYVPFPTQFVFEDNQRYMFCVQTFDMRIFFSYDEETNYDWNINQDLQPVHPIESNGDFRWAGFVGGSVPSMAVRVFDASDLAINENVIETSVFPNPAKDVVTVKVDASGTAVLKVTDLAGRTVTTNDVTIANGQFTVNVADYNAGTYLFTLVYENGANSQFNVVVAK